MIPVLADQQWLEPGKDVDPSTYLVSSEPQPESVEVIKPAPCSYNALPTLEQPLNVIDRTMPRCWVPIVYGFANATRATRFMSPATLKKSLSMVLGQLPVLAGSIDASVPNSPKVLLTGQGAWFASTKSKVRFCDMMERYLGRVVLPSTMVLSSLERTINKKTSEFGPPPLFAVKAIYYPCGSVTLTCYTNHLIADGRAMHQIVTLWGALTRGTYYPLLDGHGLLPAPPLLPSPPPSPKSSSASQQIKPEAPPLRAIRFGIALDKILKLQNEFKILSIKVTKDDIMCAMAWRVRVQGLAPHQLTKVIRVVDIRRYLGVKPSIMGNFVMGCFTPAYTVEEVMSWDLAATALVLRNALNAITPDTARRYIKNLVSIDPFNQLTLINLDNDLYVSSYSSFTPDDIYFTNDGQPAAKLFGGYYRQGALVVNPTYNNEIYGTMAVLKSQEQLFLNYQEPKLYNFTVQAMDQMRFINL